MSIDFDNLQTVTGANLLKAVNVAIATVMVGGQSYGINGRQFTRADLAELYDIRGKLQEEIAAAAAGTSGLTAHVRFGQAQ